jgi:hypothetical protein
MDVDIAETNLIPLEGDEACGMFETICRINHCCSPNARWIWSSKEGKMGQYYFTTRCVMLMISCSSSL